MDFPTALLLLLSIIGTCFFIIASNPRARKSNGLPPGPFPFPIIGNILSLGSNPHRSLAKLSIKYGPLMTLKMGNRTTTIVSSADMAKVLFQKHDVSISSRTVPASIEAVGQDKSMVWLPVGDNWRKLRKICKENLFSVNKLDGSQAVRRDKVQELCEHIKECGKAGHAVNIGEAAFTTSLNLLSTALFSKDLASFNSSYAQETKEMVWGVMKYIAKPNIADYFPRLKCVDPQGISREMKFCFDKLMPIFDGIIEEKIKSGCSKNDLTDVLLNINRANTSEYLSRSEINSLLLDLFVAGTDTTSSTVEWALVELLRNPDKMSVLKAEIQEIVGDGNEIEEKDVARLPYLQAVVKETLRIHPPAPLLVPHKAKANIEVNGYVIPKDSQILFNVWAIGRDSNTWADAESFIPERFLQSHDKVEFRGQNFELIPFGAGRRICPGMPLADRTVHLMVGTLIHKFGWKLENNMDPRGIDMSEKIGLTLHKAIPLKVIPVLKF